MTPEEIKNAIASLSLPDNAMNFTEGQRIEIVPSAFADGIHQVCPAYITKRGDKGNKMLVCMNDKGQLVVASLKRIGKCFGTTEDELLEQRGHGTLTPIKCTVTPPKPEDVNTYAMLKAQGKTQEELEKAGYPFKPSDRREFEKV